MLSCRLSRRTFGAAKFVRLSFAAIAIAMLAGGCATSETGPSRVAGPVTAFPGDPIPAARPPAVQSMKVEVEADGLPSQLAPRQRRASPDEPAEPWSPNYGTVKSAVLDTQRLAAKLDVAAAPPPAPTYAPHSRPIEADDIIRRAIAEHEMRQR